MSVPFWLRDDPLTPWFRARMDVDGWALLRRLRDAGIGVNGFAASARGPFTARTMRDGLTLAGVGASPREALARLAEKVAE